jgi:myo-inositol-1-phosphate synthase
MQDTAGRPSRPGHDHPQPLRWGLWLVGARGSVATTAAVGHAAVVRGLAGTTGLVTDLDVFAGAPLPSLDDLVLGGWDTGEDPLLKRADALAAAGVVPAGLPAAVADALAAQDERILPGVCAEEARAQPSTALDRLRADLRAFAAGHDLAHVVVVDVASTEPPLADHPAHADAEALLAAIDADQPVASPAVLYAVAALTTGAAFVDFTPSSATQLPAVAELARRHGAPLAGRDGKTGETLVKTALAPMFADRALRVRSWSGMNLLGGGDGATLADPTSAASKLTSKAAPLEAILGYRPDGPVRIDNVPDLGEWKTAWDLVAFEGFLGTRMQLQFTWQGCDSALAAPLVLDLARLAAAASAAGRGGVLEALGYFFKDPLVDGPDAVAEHRLERQFLHLVDWAVGLRA